MSCRSAGAVSGLLLVSSLTKNIPERKREDEDEDAEGPAITIKPRAKKARRKEQDGTETGTKEKRAITAAARAQPAGRVKM